MFWILYRNLWLDLNWELANVIQQKELMLTMFMLRYVDWSFISEMIAKCENRTRSNVNVEKTTDKLDILYETWISKEASCTKTSSIVIFYELFLHNIYVSQCIFYYSLYFLCNVYARF